MLKLQTRIIKTRQNDTILSGKHVIMAFLFGWYMICSIHINY